MFHFKLFYIKTQLKKFFTSAKVGDVASRAAKTFVQAFIAQWIALGEGASKAALVSGIAAGLSAVWSTTVGPWFTKHKVTRANAKATAEATAQAVAKAAFDSAVQEAVARIQGLDASAQAVEAVVATPAVTVVDTPAPSAGFIANVTAAPTSTPII